jgi:hypothetical protein
VQHDDRARVFEHLLEGRDVRELQRVDDVVGLAVGELHEAELLLVVVEGVRLGIDADDRRSAKLLDEGGERVVVLDHVEGGVTEHLGPWSEGRRQARPRRRAAASRRRRPNQHSRRGPCPGAVIGCGR